MRLVAPYARAAEAEEEEEYPSLYTDEDYEELEEAFEDEEYPSLYTDEEYAELEEAFENYQEDLADVQVLDFDTDSMTE